jgi:hypothetical protein
MRGRDALGALGIGALAIGCGSGAPAVLAFVGGVTLVGWLGGGVAAAVVASAAATVLRARGRRDCADRSSRQAGDA